MMFRAVGLRLQLCVAIFLAAPLAAQATPATYNFSSGSATVRLALEGDLTGSILEGASSQTVALSGISAVYDSATSTLDSLNISAMPFSLDLDQNQVGLDVINVSNATLQTTGPAAVSFFGPVGQFSSEVVFSALVSGTLPDGSPYPETMISSLANTGSGTATLVVSGDSLTLQLVGVTVATFSQLTNPGGPLVELKADFTFVGERVVSAVPEPSAALLFAVGTLLVGSRAALRD